MDWDCLAYKSHWLKDRFLLVARSDHTTGSRNTKLQVVFKVQKMDQYASFCLKMGPFKGKCPFLPDYGPFSRHGMRQDACNNMVRIKVSIRVGLGAVWSAILATAGLLVPQSLSKFSLVYLLAWHPPLHTPYISSPSEFINKLTKLINSRIVCIK